jgi:class 3 adenylate cyclase
MPPQTRYARSGEVGIAYQVVGEGGEMDLVLAFPFVSHLDLLAVFDGPTRAVECARAIASDTPSLGIEVRAGLHTGEVELMEDDVGGIAVHVAARVSALAGAGAVLASRTVCDLVAGSGIEFGSFGSHTLKGIPDEWDIYSVSSTPLSPISSGE